MSVYFHCRALRAFIHVCIPTESFQGSYPDPLNKHIYTIICALVSIHHRRPSAWATPILGVVINLQQKSGAQMWGLWLVVSIPEAHQHQAAACQLASSRPQSHTKIISFWWNNSSKCMTLQQQPTGWLWQCMVPSHITVQMNHMLEGSAHATLGDARCGDEDQDQFLKKSDNPDSEGMSSSLPKKSGHLQTRCVTDHDGSREVLTLCSGQFVVPGAHDIDWVLGTLKFVQSVRSTELFKSAWGTLGLKCCII